MSPLFWLPNEDPETVEIERMNEGLDFDDYEDSDDRLDEDFDERELDRMFRMSKRRFNKAAWREWRQMKKKMQESKMSRGQMNEKRREFWIGKRYEWHMMKDSSFSCIHHMMNTRK